MWTYFGYDFENGDKTEIARKEIITAVGNIVEKEDKTLTITAPETIASRAASICEKHNGKLKNSLYFKKLAMNMFCISTSLIVTFSDENI